MKSIIFIISFCAASFLSNAQIKRLIPGNTKRTTAWSPGKVQADSGVITSTRYSATPAEGELTIDKTDVSINGYFDGAWHKFGGAMGGSYNFNPSFFTQSGVNIGIDTSGTIVNFRRMYKALDSIGTRIDAINLNGPSSGDTSFIQTTYAALDASGTIDPNKLVYLKDSTRKGIFYFSGTSANQNPDNGAIDIVNAAGQVWSRLFIGPVYAKWWDIRENAAYASTNIANLRKARDYINKTGRQLIVDGNFTFADSIWFASSANVHPDVLMRGTTRFTGTSRDGIVLTGYFPLRFVHTGLIDGNNSGGIDSTSFSAYTGAGIRMKNLYNSYVDVNEMTDFKDALLMTGESTGTGTGSQFNVIYYGYLHHNYANIHITTIGSATGGNFANESFWYGRQLGQGVPGITYGARGTFGLLVDKDPSSNAPQNGIGGHVFNGFDVEAGHVGMKLSMCKDLTFMAAQFEPKGTTNIIMLDTALATGAEATTFVSANTFNENYFVPGWNGHNTKVTNTRINSLKADGTGCCVVAGTDMYRLNATKRFVIINPGPTGYTDEQVNLLNDRLMWTSDYLTTENGKSRFFGEWRYGAYKQQLLSIPNGNTGTTSDDTLQAPPNVGLVKVNTNESKVVRLNPGDQQTRFFEEFDVEKISATNITFISATGAVLIASGKFPAVGKYKCTYSLGAYTVTAYGGVVSSGSGDVSSNVSTAVDGQIAIFNGTSGKSIRTAPIAAGYIKIPSNGTYSLVTLIPTTDISVAGGSPLQSLRINSAGSAFEFYTPTTSGGSGGGYFLAGLGTGSPIYYSGPVNIGVNPSQSYAWQTFGAGRAIMEFAAASGFSPTPRVHTLEYNGTDLQLTDGSGVPQKLVKANSNITFTNAHWGGYRIGLNFLDAGSSFADDPLVSDGAGGVTTRRPPYDFIFSQTALQSISGATHSKTSILSGGAKTLSAVAVGDKIVITCIGSINVPVTPASAEIATVVVDINGYSITFPTAVNNTYSANISPNNKGYQFTVTITPTSTGTNASGRINVDNRVFKEVYAETGQLSNYNIPFTGLNTTAPVVNVSVVWGSAASSTSSWEVFQNAIEIFRQ